MAGPQASGPIPLEVTGSWVPKVSNKGSGAECPEGSQSRDSGSGCPPSKGKQHGEGTCLHFYSSSEGLSRG